LPATLVRLAGPGAPAIPWRSWLSDRWRHRRERRSCVCGDSRKGQRGPEGGGRRRRRDRRRRGG